MKPKFIRILSPITTAVIALLDVAVIYYLVRCLINIFTLYRQDIKQIFFTVCVFLAFMLAIMVTIQTFKNGIKLYDDKFEFTGIDGENTFKYADVESVETKKDTKASFTKNFNDRQSRIILNLKDERIVTIDIGLTTVKTMNKVADLITEKIEISNEATEETETTETTEQNTDTIE